MTSPDHDRDFDLEVSRRRLLAAAGMAGACSGLSKLPQDRIAGLRGIDLNEVRALADDLVAARSSKAGKEAAA